MAFARQAYNDARDGLQHRPRELPRRAWSPAPSASRQAQLCRARGAGQEREAPKVSVRPRRGERCALRPPRMNFFERQDAARRSTRALVALFAAGRGRHRAGDLRRGPSPCATTCGRRVQAAPLWTLEPRRVLGWVAAVTARRHRGRGSFYKTSRCARRRPGGGAGCSAAGRCDPNTPRPQGAAPAQRRRGDGARLRHAPCPSVYVLDEERASTPSPPDSRPTTRWWRHPRHPRPPRPRRAAGRDRPRVQPRPERRHAPQPAPDGRAARHPGHRLIGLLDPGARHRLRQLQPRAQEGRRRLRIVALRARALWPSAGIGVFFGRPDQEPPSPASASSWPTRRRCSSRATRGHRGRAQEDRRPGRRVARSTNAHAEEASHLFFGNGFAAIASMTGHAPAAGSSASAAWSRSGTARCRRSTRSGTTELVDKALADEQKPRGFADARGMADPRSLTDPRKLVQTAAAVMAAGIAGRPGAPPAAPPPSVEADPKAVTNSVGTPRRRAHQLRRARSWPRCPRRCARTCTSRCRPARSCSPCCWTVTPPCASGSSRSWAAAWTPPLHAETLRVAPMVDACAVEARLPLLDLALPALRRHVRAAVPRASRRRWAA